MKKRIVLSLFFVLLTTVTLFAQGGLPCGDGDPDGVTCPIDSWVILFAVGALIITTLYLYRKKLAVRQLSNN
jgi:hypothetical protein